MVTRRRYDVMHAQLLERLPILNRNVRVKVRNFDAEMQSFLLRTGKIGTQIRNHHVVAGKHAGFRAHCLELSLVDICYFDFLR